MAESKVNHLAQRLERRVNGLKKALEELEIGLSEESERRGGCDDLDALSEKALEVLYGQPHLSHWSIEASEIVEAVKAL